MTIKPNFACCFLIPVINQHHEFVLHQCSCHSNENGSGDVVSTLEGSMGVVELEGFSMTDSEILASDFSFE